VHFASAIRRRSNTGASRSQTIGAMASFESHAEAAEWPEIVVVASGLNVLAGLWLLVSTVVVPGQPLWGDVVVGALTSVLACARVAGAWDLALLSYVNAALGLALAVTGLSIDATTAGAANDTATGLLIFGLGLLSATASRRGRASAY
jgi:hypothetical protein